MILQYKITFDSSITLYTLKSIHNAFHVEKRKESQGTDFENIFFAVQQQFSVNCNMSGSGKSILGLWLYRSGEQEWAVKQGSPLHKRKNHLVRYEI